MSSSAGRLLEGPDDFPRHLDDRGIGKRERADDDLLMLEGLRRFHEDPHGTDVQGTAGKDLLARMSFNHDVEGHAIGFPHGNIEELFCFRQEEGGLDRLENDGISPEAGTLFKCILVVRADEDDRNLAQIRIFPDQGAELLAAHAGRIEVGNDEVQVLGFVDFERFIIR